MRLLHLTSIIGAAAMLACTAAGAAEPVASTLQLGQAVSGEACRADDLLAPGRPVDIFCGDRVESAGRLQASTLLAPLAADLAPRRALILARGKAIIDGLAVTQRLACDEGRFLGGAVAGNALLFMCTMQSNSWPRIVLVSGSDRTVYHGEGFPGMLPVLVAGISAVSGQALLPAETEAAQGLIAARLPASVVRSRASDFAEYSQFIELARVYGGRSDYAAAETALRSALDIETTLFGAESAPVGLALIELALQVSNQGRFNEAAGLFRRAAPIIQAQLGADAHARLNSYLALDAANQRDFTTALDYARQATADRTAAIDAAKGLSALVGLDGARSVSSGELAHSLRIEAEMALQLDDIAAAQAAAEEALWIISLEPGLPLWWRADALTLMAQVNERRERFPAAERNFLDAIALKERLFGDSLPVASLQFRTGRFYADQQLYPEALAHFRAAMDILAKNPSARAGIVTDQIIPFIAASAAANVDLAQRATLDSEIFRASQLVSADVADQTIARASVRLVAANPALSDLIRQAQEAERARDGARINLAAEFAKASDDRNAEREGVLTQALTTSATRADDLFARVQQEFPDYARLATPGPAELADVRAELGPGEGFISYAIGYRGSYGLLVTAKGMTAKRLDVTAETLAADIQSLRSALVPRLGTLPAFPLRDAYALYAKLLEPFAADLVGVDHLIVAPGSHLANLPFTLLVTSMPADGASYADAAWLVRRMATSQVPGPRAFLSLREAARTRVRAPRAFLGIGDPTLTGAQAGGGAALDALALRCREAGPMPAEFLRALSPLPDTAAELNAAARALGADAGSVLLGANASETGLRARPLDQYSVLYFATHGLLPGELQCQAEPGLVLSPPQTAAAAASSDGILEAGEIAVMKLNADLVVLSACNTAAAGGGRFGGGALEGLADAFFNAGARAVLATQWEVSSAATSQLMVSVFERYGQNRAGNVAQLLRQSQAALSSAPATAHPFNWAAFTVIGVGASPASDAAGSLRPQQQAANGGLP